MKLALIGHGKTGGEVLKLLGPNDEVTLFDRSHPVSEAALTGMDAAIVFVPGVAEIGRAIETIKSSAKSVDIMPLHAGLSSQEQSRVFRPPARGLRTT